jgi:hypothetical protein
MPRTYLPRAAAAAIALFASDALLAQAPPGIVIDFGSGVPLDPWSTVGAGLLIALAAYVWARRRGAGFGRLSAWIAIVAAATGTAMMASKLDLIGKAEAISGPTVVTLTSSPAIITIGTGFALLEVHNGTTGAITILAVNLQNPSEGQHIVTARGVNCAPGLRLEAGAFCLVEVDAFAPE